MIVLCLIFSVLTAFYAGYILRAGWYFRRLRPQPPLQSDFPMVSVIIPARNEESGIARCLQSVLAQSYPSDRYEVILVNDHSEDQTRNIAEKIGGAHSNFRLVDLEQAQGIAYKKAAVASGIQTARGDFILTTDADCTVGPDWVASMAAQFDAETAMVSGPVVLSSQRLFGHFQALEFMGLIAVGAGAIAAGTPNMCNGANLAYRKSVFEQVGGFAGIDHIASGDDELLMHKIVSETAYQVRFAAMGSAIVTTPALEDWAAFKAQRIRWVSKSTQYKKAGITATLVLSWLAMLGFPVLLAAGFFNPLAWYFLLAHLFLKMLGEFSILFPAARFFDKLHLLKYLPAEQIGHIFYVLWVGLAGNRSSYTWKGRSVR